VEIGVTTIEPTTNADHDAPPARAAQGHGAPPAGEPIDERPEFEPAVAHLVEPEQAMRLRAVPIRRAGDGASARVVVAMLEPGDFAAADEVAVTAGLPVERLAITDAALRELINAAYGTTAAEMAARLGGSDAGESESIANLEAIDAGELHRMAEQPTLINLVNLIILEAIRSRTSDIHIEPFDGRLSVKYRVDGTLYEQTPPPKHLQPAITSRVKIMAGMNIAERYVPQDGHITLRFEGRKVDIRVSTVPTVYGESVVMRILDKESIKLDLETLGMAERHRGVMDRLIQLPHGMVLVTGPTGSGKTTTLYACLTKLYSPNKKIITIEDPVEYELDGINQIPVNPKRGLQFATGLRAMLRQDPDVIMVGEIRDGETAEIAVRSALTGHLLFSTLHTNDAIGAVGRLIDMGVEPYLLASVLEGVLAQRLGRRIRPDALAWEPMDQLTQHRLSASERELFKTDNAQLRMPIARPSGKAGDTGFEGRVGFFELLEITPKLRTAISENAPASKLLASTPESFVTMRTDGLRKAAAGVTTVDAVLRATQDAEGDGETAGAS
jgi:type II secretory ATPase GspE/PulE/Tfp pilus assembly ATPase PilB-like protein